MNLFHNKQHDNMNILCFYNIENEAKKDDCVLLKTSLTEDDIFDNESPDTEGNIFYQPNFLTWLYNHNQLLYHAVVNDKCKIELCDLNEINDMEYE